MSCSTAQNDRRAIWEIADDTGGNVGIWELATSNDGEAAGNHRDRQLGIDAEIAGIAGTGGQSLFLFQAPSDLSKQSPAAAGSGHDLAPALSVS